MPEPLLPEVAYHIYNHANGSEDLFRSEDNYRYFLKKYAEYIYPIADTFAYCLLPNHFHLLVRMRGEEEVWEHLRTKKVRLKSATLQEFGTLGEFSRAASWEFACLFNAYTQAYNKMYDRRGSLFVPNFKRKPITDDRYFTHLIAYIHLNPVKHGFADGLFGWEHCSIHAYLSDLPSKLNRHYLQEWFGERAALVQFHENCLADLPWPEAIEPSPTSKTKENRPGD
jgi:putative transposase